MMDMYDKYEPVIGLEVHMQLLTKSKAYASDSASYGAQPNHHISPITLGHPGTLPRSNKAVVEFAVKLGLAVGSTIRRENQYARKNYFYADLPKGYQITQDTTPICNGGSITIKNQEDGSSRTINITRIHMEEDAGKSIHDQDPFDTLVDLNRAGIALLEVVSEPEIRTSSEAYQYLTEIRKLVRYLEICDGNMEEGSMRCDANISIRLKGDKALNQRTEVKNMNSIRNVQRAIDYEVKRQIEEVEAGRKIAGETRSFDAVHGTTYAMRSKELANDYRYFPEPDLQPILVEQEYIESIRNRMPALPQELFHKYTSTLGLSEYDAALITDNKQMALYFEELIAHTSNFKSAVNWMMGGVKSYLNENAVEIEGFPLKPAELAALIQLIDAGKISHTAATQKLFPAMIDQPGSNPESLAAALNLLIESSGDALKEWAEAAIAKYPEKVAEFKAGKTGLLGLFMGELMKQSKGKADPKAADQILRELLSI